MRLFEHLGFRGEMAELVEGARLEIVYTGNSIKGSNPFLSATNNRTDGCGYFFVSARNSARRRAFFVSVPPFYAPPLPRFFAFGTKGGWQTGFSMI